MTWLLNLGGEINPTGYLELLVVNPFDRRASGVLFSSVEKRQVWVEDQSKRLLKKNKKRVGKRGYGI
ncbi:MAG: hypothetical protein ACI978_000011 [Oleispira sp.]|jgi:hypothetical protein